MKNRQKVVLIIMSALQILTTFSESENLYFNGLVEKPIEPSIRVQWVHLLKQLLVCIAARVPLLKRACLF